MAKIDWSSKGLTDSEVATKLEELADDVDCEELYLQNNQLQNVPDLTKYKQFAGINRLCFGTERDVFKIDISHNDLTFVQQEHLPPSVTHLDLSGNELTEVPDFSQCVNLENLNLCNNNLSVVKPQHLPPSLTHLDLSLNQLAEVPNFSQCVKLQELNLQNNNLSVVQPEHVPPSLTHLDLSWNKLTEVSNFSQCVNLQKLYLHHNNLSDVEPEHLPPSLKHIDLSENKLTEMSEFSQCLNLQRLELHHNILSVVQPELLPPSLTHLYLYKNKLTKVSDFSQCVKLQELKLQSNRLRVVKWELLPPSLTYLDLSENKLNEVSDFSQCGNLQRLYLQRNKLSVVLQEHLPPSLIHLNMSQNKLTALQDFSQHQNLKCLEIYHNHSLHTIHGLPQNLEYFSCENSPVEFIKKNAFHKNTYGLLHKVIGKTSLVKQPPYGVYNQGLDAVLDYFTEKSVETTQNSMMLLGPSGAGKTSVIESLMNEIPVLVDQRTQVANIKEWNLSEKDIIEVFDQGGHPIYNITNPIFLSPSCIRFIVHDITKVEDTKLEESSKILIQSLQIHPENQIHVVLTHTDMMDAVGRNSHEKMVKEKLKAAIDQEVKSLRCLAVSDKEERDSKKLLSRQLQHQKKNINYFLVSNKTYQGLRALKHFLMELIAPKRIHIPEKWVQFYKLMMRQKCEFWKVEDLEPIFKCLYSTSEPQKTRLATFQTVLRHFRNSGLIMYFDNISSLDEYVFHKKTFLVDLFKCCFHHNLTSTIDFKALGKLSYFKRNQAELMVKQYQSEGILSTELLHYLWHKYGIDRKVQKAVLTLMKKFQLCHPINSSEELFFFPWFTQNKKCPSRINPNKLFPCDQNHFSVQLNCQFTCSIPVNCFEVLLVQIQKIALENHFGDDRHAWKDGLAIKIGTLECVAVRMPQKSTISICVQGHRKDVDKVWQFMTIIHSDLKSYLKKLEGVIEKIYFTCNHCVIKDLRPYHQRFPTEVFQICALDLRHTTCRGDEIPTALVYAPSVNSRQFREHLENVDKYLKANCQDTSPPGTLLYLDCEEVSDGKLLLSWCWPQSKDETLSEGMDNTFTHAVVEYREGQEWIPVTEDVKQSPFSLQCQAEEVRVAAVNEYGQGKFSYAKPFHVVDADEVLTEHDRYHLEANHEFFSRMTSVFEVVLRLFSRGVLSKREKEHLIRLVADKDKRKTAASHLMESVGKLRYKQLYLFKKTLIEIGQSTMAGAVPVKLVEDMPPAVPELPEEQPESNQRQ